MNADLKARLLIFIQDFAEHIDSIPESKLLKLDSDPHPPSVFSVMRDVAMRLRKRLEEEQP